MRTMAFQASYGIVLAVHGELEPTDAEWDAFVELCGKNLNGKAIVWSDSSKGPSPKQRSKLNDRIKAGPLRTAVCSPAVFVRGVVTAFSWFNPNIKAFTKEEFDAALKHIGAPPHVATPLLAELKKMRASLDG